MLQREIDLPFTACRCGNANVFCYLQSVGAQNGTCLPIYKVWERKLELVWLFTKCESENANVFCYLQRVGGKIELQF